MKKYYLHQSTKKLGPFDIEDLQNWNLTKDTKVWHEGLEGWTRLEKIDELKKLLKNQNPPAYSPYKKEDAAAQGSDAADFYSEYAKSATTLRVWFVTFGIGGLYLLLTNSALLDKLKLSQSLIHISFLFLLGIGVQLFIAVLNKWVNWYNYYFDGDKETWFARMIDTLSRQFWLDIFADITSCICFGIIIWKMVTIFSS